MLNNLAAAAAVPLHPFGRGDHTAPQFDGSERAVTSRLVKPGDPQTFKNGSNAVRVVGELPCPDLRDRHRRGDLTEIVKEALRLLHPTKLGICCDEHP